jgi:hypothetical protein
MTCMRLRRWAFVLLAATPGLSCIVHPVAAHPEAIPPDEASSQRGSIHQTPVVGPAEAPHASATRCVRAATAP